MVGLLRGGSIGRPRLLLTNRHCLFSLLYVGGGEVRRGRVMLGSENKNKKRLVYETDEDRFQAL
jgi:hypothetical protein